MKNLKKKRSKPETRLRIAQAVMRLEIRKGHLAWKVTELVRLIKVSRPLVYRYFGHTKKEILRCAFEEFTNDFFGFNDDPTLSFIDRVLKAQQFARENPEVVIFYTYWRNVESEWKYRFKKIESSLRQNIKTHFPYLTQNQVLKTHVMLHGLVTAPFLSSKELKSHLSSFFNMCIT